MSRKGLLRSTPFVGRGPDRRAVGTPIRFRVSDQLLLAGLEETARHHRPCGQQVEDRAEADRNLESDAEAVKAGGAAEGGGEQPKGQQRDEDADARAGPAEGLLAQPAG